MPEQVISWEAAVREGQRRVPRGPNVTAAEANSAVADLRRFAREAELHVRETTGLGADLPVAEAQVVDRRGWVAAAAEGMQTLAEPVMSRLTSQPPEIAAKLTGKQLGLLLAYLSGRILGQYDPVGGGGRLLLVAPNVIKIERDIEAEPADFRLWVCLHESTHRLQFSAVPWMVAHFRQLIDRYAEATPLEGSELLRRVIDAFRGPRESAGGTARTPDDSWMRRIQTPEQRVIFDELMALMTLLEGHADHVMDAVGPQVVPSVAGIRESFSVRRARGAGVWDRIVRALLGMDLKMAQYVRGAAFVRGVTERVGMAGFNAVFTAPETLPTLIEISDPAAWVRRVHG